MKSLPVPRQSSGESNHFDTLEVIETDTRTFAVESYDWYHFNVKFVDVATGFVSRSEIKYQIP
jgi:hypothetical protein